MWWLLLVVGPGCSDAADPQGLSPAQQRRILLGPVAHAWRDLARAQSGPGDAALQYRAMAAALEAVPVPPTDPELGAWRDLLVRSAQRDAAWGEALVRQVPLPASDLGPISELRALALDPRSGGAVTASASLLLQDPPWASWSPDGTPWLDTAALALDAAPPFAVDAHWGAWRPQQANRQAAGLAFSAQGKGSPAAFVAGMARRTGPSPLRAPLGCDLYRDVAGEAGPPDPVPAGVEQAMRSAELLARIRAQDLAEARAAVGPLVDSRDPRCPGAAFFLAGLTGRLLLAEGDPGAIAELERAVYVGRTLLSGLLGR